MLIVKQVMTMLKSKIRNKTSIEKYQRNFLSPKEDNLLKDFFSLVDFSFRDD